MKKIYNIINRELIVRTNNVRLRQEYGEMGTAQNIKNIGNETVFYTVYGIDKIVYVTVNGINLIEGVHYTVTSDFTIAISKDGNSPVRQNPTLTTNILVGYHHNSRLSPLIAPILDAPTIDLFYINPIAGKEGEILFNFSILENDGRNIYWSIIKDGLHDPLFSGSVLSTLNSTVPDGQGGVDLLSYQVSLPEYTDRVGDTMPFTLVVVYDLTEDGTNLDEKVMATAAYEFLPDAVITGSIDSTPSLITEAGFPTIAVTHAINLNGYTGGLAWAVITRRDGHQDQIIVTGDETTLSGMHTYSIGTAENESYTNTYDLEITRAGESFSSKIASSSTVINVAGAELDAYVGYMDPREISYAPGRTIGDTGSAQDITLFNALDPDSFTKIVDKSYLIDGQNRFLAAPFYTAGGAYYEGYFAIKAPTSWGPLDFYQLLGLTDITAFNILPLGDGYTAYIYVAAPTPSANPTDFYLKPANR